jgi:hypothetical protein
VTALADADWPPLVYFVLDEVWIVTVEPSAVLAVIVWPLTLETV